MPLECRAEKEPFRGRNIQVVVFDGHHVGRLIMEEHPEGLIYEPTFSLGPNQAQMLMDDLWAAGVRPTEGTGSAGSLKATEKHLEDMRKIAFKWMSLEP